jgi:hypothetical protein
MRQRKPFWLIDYKLREADFFLEKLRCSDELNEARYYFSAFLSAARSVTYAIQVCLHGLGGSKEWWEERRQRLKDDAIARYFHLARNEGEHTGLNPLQVQMRGSLPTRSEFLLAAENMPELEAVRAGESYMALLVQIAGEAFGAYWSSLNLSPDITIADLQRTGRSLESLEEEFGLPKGYTASESLEFRLNFLKNYSRTDIERLARQYPPSLIQDRATGPAG